jgi:K+-sensing histidine kinase KdpD
VICANNADEALNELKKTPPDLILSDVMMPGLSGFELLAEIKKNPSYFTIPFIFLTARAEFADIRKGMNIGSDDYLIKPFRAKELLNSVKIRLEKKELYDKKIDRISENLSSHVPHELRTPLVTIVGYPDILLDYYDDFSDEEKKDMIKSIKDSGVRLHETVEKFIILSEVQKLVLDNDVKNDPNVNNIEGILLELGGLLSNKYKEKNSFSVNVEDAELSISENLFKTLMKQIIDNAYKYSDPPIKVTVIGKSNDDGYLFEIRDNGVGLSEEEIKILDTFIQYERDRRVLSGLGLGLKIVKQILSYYNSKLKIESKKGAGSTFSFLIDKKYIN